MPLHQIIFAGVMLAACIYAIARGGAPERLTAYGFLLAFVLTNMVQKGPGDAYHSVERMIALVDAGLLGAVLFVALVSCRFWGMAMACLMIVDVLGHFAKLLLAQELFSPVYYALVALVSYPMIALLAIGTWRHRRRLRRYGVDYSWVWQLPPAYRLGWIAVPHTAGDERS